MHRGVANRFPETIQFANAICEDQAGVSDLPQTATCASNGTTTMTSSGTTATQSGSSGAAGATTTGTGGATAKFDDVTLGMVVAGLVAAL